MTRTPTDSRIGTTRLAMKYDAGSPSSELPTKACSTSLWFRSAQSELTTMPGMSPKYQKQAYSRRTPSAPAISSPSSPFAAASRTTDASEPKPSPAFAATPARFAACS